MRLVASITSVPAGTCTSRSLIFSVTNFCSAMTLARPHGYKRFRRFVRAAPVQVIFKFVAPLLHDADSRQSGGIAERAEGAAEHIFRQVAHEIDVFRAAEAGVEAL